MIADAPSLGRIDQGPEGGAPLDLSKIGKAGALGKEPFRSPVGDFYMTNAIARASKTMAECSATMAEGAKAKSAHAYFLKPELHAALSQPGGAA